MQAELELVGRLLAFRGIVEQELDLLDLDVKSLIPHMRNPSSENLRDGLDLAIDRVRYIQQKCGNVLGHLPCPSPLEPGKEV